MGRDFTFSSFECINGKGNRSFWLVKRPQKLLTDKFYGCEKVTEKVLVLSFTHILKTLHLKQLKEIQILNKVHEKGTSGQLKKVWREVRGWTSGQNLPL